MEFEQIINFHYLQLRTLFQAYETSFPQPLQKKCLNRRNKYIKWSSNSAQDREKLMFVKCSDNQVVKLWYIQYDGDVDDSQISLNRHFLSQ